jgi:hypothetical protein
MVLAAGEWSLEKSCPNFGGDQLGMAGWPGAGLGFLAA